MKLFIIFHPTEIFIIFPNDMINFLLGQSYSDQNTYKY